MSLQCPLCKELQLRSGTAVNFIVKAVGDNFLVAEETYNRRKMYNGTVQLLGISHVISMTINYKGVAITIQ